MVSLSEFRKSLGLTQAEMGSKMGVTRETINRAENGDVTDTLRWRFTRAFGLVAAGEVFGAEISPTLPQTPEAVPA